MWVKVYGHKYLCNNNLFTTTVSVNSSIIWWSLVKALTQLWEGFIYKLGGGDIYVWFDPLLEEGHLSNLVEYVNVLDVNYKVKDWWTNEAWDFSKLATSIPEAIRYCIMASPIPLLPGVVDKVIWAATMTVV